MKANGTEFADSWINDPEIQCSAATQYPDQHQCKRSAYDGGSVVHNIGVLFRLYRNLVSYLVS